VRAGDAVGSCAPLGARWRQPRLARTRRRRSGWGARAAAVPPTMAAAQTGADASAAGSTEIATFTGGAALPPRTGTMVTMGSRPLSGTSVLAAGGLLSSRPTTSSGSR
jgi:hypothetical protein